SFTHLYVVDEHDHVQGIILAREVEKIRNGIEKPDDSLQAKDICIPVTYYFNVDDTLDTVIKAFGASQLDEFPAVDEHVPMKLIGTISKDDVIKAYNNEMVKRDMVSTVSGYIGSADKFKQIKMSNGQVLSEIEIPGIMVNKTLSELDLRNQIGIEVILIKQNFDSDKKEMQNVMTPRPNYRFQYNDIVLVIGTEESLKKFKKLA
ncbi:MAG TPA: hypothetical protein ENH02_01945, partial [Bacteroidetes bacterium]|nr:hypothetical protein [Bacteroidota bacterium]